MKTSNTFNMLRVLLAVAALFACFSFLLLNIEADANGYTAMDIAMYSEPWWAGMVCAAGLSFVLTIQACIGLSRMTNSLYQTESEWKRLIDASDWA